MRLTHVELHRLALPLVSPFRTAHGVTTTRDVLLVRVLGADAQGWGECVAEAVPSYSAEYVDGAHDVIRRFLVPRLGAEVPGADVTADEMAARFAGVVGHPMAKAALETAVLDAECRAAGVRLVDRLGGVREAVPAGVAVGQFASTGELLDVVAGYVAEGYRRVKLKVEPGHDVAPVRAVRERFGSDLLLQVDANQSYTIADLATLEALDAFDLLLIEQPLPADDLIGHAEVARRLRTPICLDESITSARVAALALALGACSVVNVKPGRVGGLLEAVRIHDLCVEAGVPVWCGGMLETGIGRAGNVALAALPGFTLPGDLSASARYFHRDVTEAFVLDGDGCLAVPAGPGSGASPDPAALAELRTRPPELLALPSG